MIQAVEQAAKMPPAKYSQGKESAREGQRERAKEKGKNQMNVRE